MSVFVQRIRLAECSGNVLSLPIIAVFEPVDVGYIIHLLSADVFARRQAHREAQCRMLEQAAVELAMLEREISRT